MAFYITAYTTESVFLGLGLLITSLNPSYLILI